ncbi:hypothetical protein BH09PSE1_BH09PSE1_01360 [soil metagenome]
MKSLALAAVAVSLAAFAAPADAQVYSSQPYGAPSYGGQGYGYSESYSSSYGSSSYGSACGSRCGDRRHDRRRYDSYNGQQDRPGDYRCDAYWDANRTDCNAAWRDQRPWRPARRTYSHQGYGGPAVYPGEYGRPDVVYSGGYRQGGQYADPYGHDHSGYGQYGRDPQRVNWCCIQYRSYDPTTGYYTAYSGERIFCG